MQNMVCKEKRDTNVMPHKSHMYMSRPFRILPSGEHRGSQYYWSGYETLKNKQNEVKDSHQPLVVRCVYVDNTVKLKKHNIY